jgi:DtxR family transcriptional regulator, manganese transport regulator
LNAEEEFNLAGKSRLEVTENSLGPMNELSTAIEGRPEKDKRREEVIRALLDHEGVRLSQSIIDGLKRDLGVSRATAYRIIKTYRTCGAVTAPTTRPVGRPKGARVLDGRREAIIRETIETFYLQPSRPKFSELVREIGGRCEKEKLPAPNWRTVKARLNDIDYVIRARRRNGGE